MASHYLRGWNSLVLNCVGLNYSYAMIFQKLTKNAERKEKNRRKKIHITISSRIKTKEKEKR